MEFAVNTSLPSFKNVTGTKNSPPIQVVEKLLVIQNVKVEKIGSTPFQCNTEKNELLKYYTSKSVEKFSSYCVNERTTDM